MLKLSRSSVALLVLCLCGPALGVAGEGKPGEAAQAAKDRSKPLQRCDRLKDKAELECLHKARERIVEARKKREASGKGGERALPATDEKAPASKAASAASNQKK